MCKCVETFNNIEKEINALQNEIKSQKSIESYLKHNDKILNQISNLSYKLDNAIKNIMYLDRTENTNILTIDFYDKKITPIFKKFYEWCSSIIGNKNGKKTLPIIIKSENLFGEQDVIINVKVLSTREYITKLKTKVKRAVNIIKDFVYNAASSIVTIMGKCFFSFEDEYTTENKKRVKSFNDKAATVASIVGGLCCAGLTAAEVTNPFVGVALTAITTFGPQLFAALNNNIKSVDGSKTGSKSSKKLLLSVIGKLSIKVVTENPDELNKIFKAITDSFKNAKPKLNKYYNCKDLNYKILFDEAK